VFPNRDGQPLDAPNLINRGFKPALRRAGLREIRLHDLRHTCASLLLSAGIDVVAVSRLLGHSSPIVTLNIYSHAIRKDRAGVTDKLSELLCDASSSKLVADERNQLEDIAGSADKSLSELVGRDGIEPSTNWLKASCSTAELTARPGRGAHDSRLAAADHR